MTGRRVSIDRDLLDDLMGLAFDRDAAGLLGTCEHHMVGEFCTVCTTLVAVQQVMLDADDVAWRVDHA
jgi:hypothetical protein